MSWAKTSSLRPPGEQKVRIKTKYSELGLSDLEQEQTGNAVQASRTIMPRVIAMMSWPNAQNMAVLDPLYQRYFKIVGAIDAADRNVIIKKLELVCNGISSKINVKVAQDADAYGYVGFKTGATGVLRGVFSPRHNIGRRNGDFVSRGDIHLDRGTLGDANLTIITFIHEATHKYASTADHGASGYLNNLGTDFEAAGLTKNQALNNADSYAWFCFSAII